MSSIDERIVRMEFQNSQFERGIASTQDALAGLSRSLDGETLGNKFSALGAIGFSGLQRLTNSVIDAGARMGSALIAPIIEGGKKRSLNLAQAKFQFQGLGMDVEATMADASYAVDGTAYSLDVAAKAAAQFGASGVQSGDDMKAALRGIAGIAAMTGNGYEDISDIFTKVAGQGRAMAEDFNRIGGRGVNAYAVLAESMGTTEQAVRQMTTEGKISFDIFSKALNDAFGEHATKANETYVGSLANVRSALGRIGADYYTPHFEKMRQVFVASIPVVNAIRQAIQPFISGLLQFENIGYDGIINFMNTLSNVFGSTDPEHLGAGILILRTAIQNITTSLLNIVRPIKQAFSQIFPPATEAQIMNLIRGFSDLTRIFRVTDQQSELLRKTFAGFFAIFSMIGQVISFVGKLIWSALKPVIDSMGLMGDGILGVTATFGDWLVAADSAMKQAGYFEEILNKVVDAMGPVGEWLSTLRDRFQAFLNSGDIQAWFDDLIERLRKVPGEVQKFFTDLGTDISEYFSGLFGSDVEFQVFLERLKTSLIDVSKAIKEFFASSDSGEGFGLFDRLEDIGGRVRAVWEQIAASFKRVKDAIGPAFESLKNVFSDLKNGFAGFMSGLDPRLTQGTLNLGMFTTAVIVIKQLITTLKEGSFIPSSITSMFTGVTNSLNAMAFDLKAGAILKIAFAIGVLAASLWLLAQIPSESLLASVAAMGGLSLLLLGMVVALEQMADSKGFAKIPSISVSMILLGGALLLLALAAARFQDMSWEEMAKSLVGLSAALAATNLARGGKVDAIALFALALALKTLASAFQQFASLSWEDLAKGGSVMLATMGLTFAMAEGMNKLKINPAGIMQASAGMLILAVAMMAMVGAIKLASMLDPAAFGYGLGVIAASLALIVGAMRLMPANLPALAVGLLVIAGAMGILTGVLAILGTFSDTMMVKSLIMLAGSLIIITAALNMMQGTVAGSAALLLAAFAIATLTPSLLALGMMDLQSIGIALLAIAGVFAVLGLSAALLAPTIPLIVLLSAAILLLGVGAMAAGAGLFLMGIGLASIAAAGVGAIPVMIALIMSLVNMIPLIAQKLAEGLGMFLITIAGMAPQILETFTVVLMALLDAVEIVGPRLLEVIFVLIMKLVDLLAENVPLFVERGMELLVGVLEGIRDHIGDVVTTALEIIEELLLGLAEGIPDVISAGVELLEAVMKGIGEAIPRLAESAAEMVLEVIDGLTAAVNTYAGEIQAAAAKLGFAIIDGITGGLASKARDVANSAKKVASDALGAVTRFLGINSPSKVFFQIGQYVDDGFANGIRFYGSRVTNEARAVASNALSEVSNAISSIPDALGDDLSLSPVITPVLNLSEMQKTAGQIDGLLTPSDISMFDYGKASSIANDRRVTQELQSLREQTTPTNVAPVNYTQINNSPKALSPVDVYRQTKNLLSVTKGDVV